MRFWRVGRRRRGVELRHAGCVAAWRKRPASRSALAKCSRSCVMPETSEPRASVKTLVTGSRSGSGRKKPHPGDAHLVSPTGSSGSVVSGSFASRCRCDGLPLKEQALRGRSSRSDHSVTFTRCTADRVVSGASGPGDATLRRGCRQRRLCRCRVHLVYRRPLRQVRPYHVSSRWTG